VVFRLPGTATVCRQALRVGPDGLCLPPPETPAAYGPQEEDPRFLRFLPWSLARLGPFTLDFFVRIVLLAIPLPLLYLAVRRRSWLLGVVFVLDVGLTVLLFLALDWEKPYLGFFYRRTRLPVEEFLKLDWGKRYLALGSLIRPLWPVVDVIAALCIVPLLLFLYRLAAGVGNARWRQVRRLLAASVAAAALLAVPWLVLDSKQMVPPERYSWHGWYLIWFPGACAVGTMVVVVPMAGRVFRRVFRLVQWERA
jgi:hypothetical protein